MNLCLRVVLPFVAVGLLSTAPIAVAADYDPPVVVDQAPEMTPVEVGSGWYLRGDIAYSFNDSPYQDFGIDGIGVDSTRFGAGGGVGYHFTDMFRADATINFLSSDQLDFATPDVAASLENQMWDGMANIYIDLGTYSGLTPYIGAGIGALYSRNTADITAGGFIAQATDTQTELAYSLMVGASYKVGTNSSIDLGYQFTSSPDTEFLDTSTLNVEKGVDFHQIKLGFRYDLW